MASPLIASAARGAAVPSTSAPAVAAPVSRSRRQPLVARRRCRRSSVVASASPNNSSKSVTLLDYGAGNVRSVRNAIRALGYELKEVRESEREREREREKQIG